jgi:hypothetical protein
MQFARFLVAIPLVLIVSSCGSVNFKQNSPICDGLSSLIYDHVDALIEDGGPRSLSTGRRLVVGFDAGCEDE